MLPLSMVIVIAIVVIVTVAMVAAMIYGLSFKTFVELAIGIIGVGGSIIAIIEFFYSSNEKKVDYSQNKVFKSLQTLHSCIIDEMNGTGGSCANTPVDTRDIIASLVALDGSLASDRYSTYIPILISNVMRSPTIYKVWNENRSWFSRQFNEYVLSLSIA
jgi:hypothetical protein